MQLITPCDDTFIEIMSWFATEQQLASWSGPGFEYPFTLDTFKRDLGLATRPSYALSANDELLAFGQYYLREGRCHLGRLVVNPKKRGQGIAQQLIDRLTQLGCQQLAVNECSLFVLHDNQSALTAYQKHGFVETLYPEKIPLENCIYMIKKVGK